MSLNGLLAESVTSTRPRTMTGRVIASFTFQMQPPWTIAPSLRNVYVLGENDFQLIVQLGPITIRLPRNS